MIRDVILEKQRNEFRRMVVLICQDNSRPYVSLMTDRTHKLHGDLTQHHHSARHSIALKDFFMSFHMCSCILMAKSTILMKKIDHKWDRSHSVFTLAMLFHESDWMSVKKLIDDCGFEQRLLFSLTIMFLYVYVILKKRRIISLA